MPEEKRRHAKYLEKAAASELKGPDWENEPPLEAEQCVSSPDHLLGHLMDYQ